MERHCALITLMNYTLGWIPYELQYRDDQDGTKDYQGHPRTGIGHPEPLKSGGGITYSRRISAHDRIIYDIYDDTITVLVIEVEGHYDDK